MCLAVGWPALLTTHGTSLLAAQPLVVLDLTGEIACQELAETAAAAGVPAVSWLLPSQLAAAGVLSTFTPAQLAAALAEAIHADSSATVAAASWLGAPLSSFRRLPEARQPRRDARPARRRDPPHLARLRSARLVPCRPRPDSQVSDDLLALVVLRVLSRIPIALGMRTPLYLVSRPLGGCSVGRR